MLIGLIMFTIAVVLSVAALIKLIIGMIRTGIRLSGILLTMVTWFIIGTGIYGIIFMIGRVF